MDLDTEIDRLEREKDAIYCLCGPECIDTVWCWHWSAMAPIQDRLDVLWNQKWTDVWVKSLQRPIRKGHRHLAAR